MNGKVHGRWHVTSPCDIRTNNNVDRRTPSLRGEILGADTTGPAVARVGTTDSSHSGADEYPRETTQTNKRWYTHISQLTQFMPPPGTYTK